MELNKIIQGDCLEVMKTLPENSVDAIVSDPPYGLSFMGKRWDYDVPSQEIWEECLRVLKPGGYLLAFAGTRTQHRMAVRIEDAGFEIRDMIAWVYGSGFPKSLNIGKAVDKLQGNEREETDYIAPDGKKRWGGNSFSVGEAPDGRGINKQTKGTSEWEGWGTALKPALEPITVARKPLEGHEISNLEEYLDKQGFPSLSKILKKKKLTVAENCLKWGVGGINIDGCRIDFTGDKDKEGWKYGAAGKENKSVDSWKNTSKVIIQNEVTGRFPANLIHDGSDEVVSLFPNTKSGALKSDCYKEDRENDSMFAGGGNFEHRGYKADSGSASRFFMTCKDDPKRAILKVCIKNGNVEIVEKDLATMSLIEQVSSMFSALKNVTQSSDLLNQNLSVLSAEKSVDSTEISFVQNLVAILTGGQMEYTGEMKQTEAWLKSLTQEALLNIIIELNNLAWFAGKQVEELKDTIKTITYLKILYGYVGLATSESTLARFKYQSKASKSERNRGCEGLPLKEKVFNGQSDKPSQDMKDVEKRFTTRPKANNHPTVKPIALMEYLVKLVSREGAVVLDPFAGSGSTLIACKNLKRNFIGIELDPEYVKIAEARLLAVKKEATLF